MIGNLIGDRIFCNGEVDKLFTSMGDQFQLVIKEGGISFLPFILFECLLSKIISSHERLYFPISSTNCKIALGSYIHNTNPVKLGVLQGVKP